MKRIDTIPAHLATDFAYCRDIALARAEEAPLGGRFLKRRLKPYWYVISAFFWTARDFTRLRGSDDDLKLQLIDDWARRLEQARSGQPDHPIFRAMAHLFAATGLPEAPLHALLIACRMDVTNRRHGTLEELDEYGRFASAPLGHLLLHLHQEMEESAEVRLTDKLRHSDALWTALSWTGFWRDLGHDSRGEGPLYLPEVEMGSYGVAEEMVLQRRFTPMVGSLMMHLVDETRARFFAGSPLIEEVDRPLRMELAYAMERGMMLLERIEDLGGNTLRNRPALSRWEHIICLWRAMGRVSN
ncbi:MAG: squalene/phytoene synthase family protein [Magnetococcales bacterium]|nr:squalene/phytoene synthase family protein [Magnetococcales bacterium]